MISINTIFYCSGVLSSGNLMYNEIENSFYSSNFEKNINLPFPNIEYKVEYVSENSIIVSYKNNKLLVSKTICLSKPHQERPFEGNMNIFIDSLHSLEVDLVFPSNTISLGLLSSSIEKNFRQSKFLDLESLLIKPCELSWNIRIDIHILESDSYVMDVCSFAILYSLLKLKIPITNSNEDGKVVVLNISEKAPKNINFFFYPYIFTFPSVNSKDFSPVSPCRLLLGFSNTLELLSLFQITDSTYSKEMIFESFEFYRQKLSDNLSFLKVK
jgi:hypothetical protein